MKRKKGRPVIFRKVLLVLLLLELCFFIQRRGNGNLAVMNFDRENLLQWLGEEIKKEIIIEIYYE